MVNIIVNGTSRDVDVEGDTPLLWVLREDLGLTGTKFGCGIAECGACTVHVNGEAIRSCVTPVSTVAGRQITTIEGLSPDSSHPVQQAWLTEQVPQCGYCQSGQIMATVGVSQDHAEPDRRRHRCRAHQHLPLRHLRAAPPRGASRRSLDAHVSGRTPQ